MKRVRSEVGGTSISNVHATIRKECMGQGNTERDGTKLGRKPEGDGAKVSSVGKRI